MWLFPASFNSALDGFHRGAMTVLAQVLVCIAGAEQRVSHGFFVDPVARDHPTHTEGHGIERLVTLTVRGGAEFGGRTVKRRCRISLAARAVCSLPLFWRKSCVHTRRVPSPLVCRFGRMISASHCGSSGMVPALKASANNGLPLTDRHRLPSGSTAPGAMTKPPIPRTSMPSGSSPRPLPRASPFRLLEEQMSAAARCFCHRRRRQDCRRWRSQAG